MLCGYFSTMNMVLWNNRYKEVIDIMYDYKSPFFLLTNHTYNKALVNTLLIYLNLDLTRNPTLIPQRTQLKLQTLKCLFDQIRMCYGNYRKDEGRNQKNEIVIENVCEVMIEIVQKYYLITDGKAMLDFILSQENVDLIMEVLIFKKDVSLTVVNLAMVIMRFYCLSSFNQEDPNNFENTRKNQERL